MKITRRFAVATLLILAVAIVLGAPAPASATGKGRLTWTFKLYPTADSPSRHATGTVTLYPSDTPPLIDAVSVSVSKLAPNASYYMPVTVSYFEVTIYGTNVYGSYVYNVPIQTDASGNGAGGYVCRSYYDRNGNLIYYERGVSSLYDVYDASGTLVLTRTR
jgi:hypothetical protein